jgi:hypothetical protein
MYDTSAYSTYFSQDTAIYSVGATTAVMSTVDRMYSVRAEYLSCDAFLGAVPIEEPCGKPGHADNVIIISLISRLHYTEAYLHNPLGPHPSST